ncbi:hypothetical protein WYO_5196 [Methylobacterium sp. GXF4]|uniref:hypothetical protein n=1 Tax=Methylobacterium sp. GXF4 TaxID=1096546 RepID=UPI00026993BD|nr:hypothetical protein [Methylobacterium sp. GXF4]EIZ82156.1 hypothetical protein WYO_5196 [Methylobacterium sp. GXF4]
MAGDDTLAKALADVRQRRADLQADYERLTTELNKLRTAEKSLAAIVEGGALDEAGPVGLDPAGEVSVRTRRVTGRGSRGPRANSAKGRLKALLEETGPQGLSHAEIEQRLPDIAPNTLNTYLSMMVTGGEAVRRGDFYVAAPSPRDEAGAEDAEDATGAEERDESGD